MAKLNRIKELLQKALEVFGQVSTDKGIVAWSGEGELPEVGDAVHGLDEDGNEIALEDGEYTLESGVILVIKDGKVEEIKDPIAEPEAEPAEPAEPEADPEESGEDTGNTENAEDEPEPAAEPEEDPMEKRMAELEARLAALEEKLAAIEAKPAAEPATEEFRSVNTFKATGNEKMDKLMRIMNAK